MIRRSQRSGAPLRRLAALGRQLEEPVEKPVALVRRSPCEGVTAELMKPGKAAMCMKIASSKAGAGDPNSPYGDYFAAIQNVEVVDIAPGKVLVDETGDPKVLGQRLTKVVEASDL